MLRLADYPQLRRIAWNRRDEDVVDEREALALYETNWRFVDQTQLGDAERALIERLVTQFGGGILHV